MYYGKWSVGAAADCFTFLVCQIIPPKSGAAHPIAADTCVQAQTSANVNVKSVNTMTRLASAGSSRFIVVDTPMNRPSSRFSLGVNATALKFRATVSAR